MDFSFSLSEDYWSSFDLKKEDIEFLYYHLLELETPLSPQELVNILIEHRINNEKQTAQKQRAAGGTTYRPKDKYTVGEKVVLPALGWQPGSVVNVRPGRSYAKEEFEVIEIEFEDGQKREFAAGYDSHPLNDPVVESQVDPQMDAAVVLENYGEQLVGQLLENLTDNPDFVYIAGRWFPKALIVDVNVGNLNLAEALLDMESGGPLATAQLLDQVELPEGVNPHLAEFSLDHAMQEDDRFDEVGPAGKVSWFLKRVEPEGVLKTPLYLRYRPIEYDRTVIQGDMLALERQLDDELSPHVEPEGSYDQVEVNLIYGHWRSGTLPLTARVSRLFPTAYESPRIRFMLVDGDTGDKFPGWVVRMENYVYGLAEWYKERGVMPGSSIKIRRGSQPGEVIVQAESHRSAKEWVRTALVGADGGVVYAMLKQSVSTTFDQRMVVAMPAEIDPLDQAWKTRDLKPLPFEQVVVDTMRTLAKLNPQSHVHVTELYSAVNVILRCPPGPIMSLLASRPWFSHLGDLHFRSEETDLE
ncbi:MAG: hypothetical protein OEZ02_03235 [Anaerolineae bacterium]|nr:hypothetical protein [Anaerolineae bacterium]